MKIPTRILKKWKLLKDHGDITKIADGDDTRRVTISTALSNGECSEEIFRLISEFYNKREQLLKTS